MHFISHIPTYSLQNALLRSDAVHEKREMFIRRTLSSDGVGSFLGSPVLAVDFPHRGEMPMF